MIITCIVQGKRNKEIAFQLETTEQVIKNYLRKIYERLGVTDRLELALYCLHNKIFDEGVDDIAAVLRAGSWMIQATFRDSQVSDVSSFGVAGTIDQQRD